MHELSIAIALLDAAAAEAQRQGNGRVVALHLRLGSLSGVIPDALLGAWKQACDGTPLTGCRLVVQDVPIMIACPACSAERPARSAQDMCCAECGTPATKVVAGREIELTALEILDAEPT